jgi:hypothetical protein
VKNTLDVSPVQRFKWMEVVLKKCGPWSPVIHKVVETNLKPLSQAQRTVKLSDKPIYETAAYKQAVRKWCPGMLEALERHTKDTKSRRDGFRKAVDEWYRICKVAERGVVTKKELLKHNTVVIAGMMVHEQLVKRGLDPRVARTVARLFIPDDVLMSKVWAHKLQLPRSRSASEVAHGVMLIISRTEINVQGVAVANVRQGKVDDNHKRDGPNGYFINPLFVSLNAEAKRRLAVSKAGGRPFAGNIVVMVDGRSPYRLLAECLYTAGQAQFKNIQLAVRRSDRSVGMIYLPVPRYVMQQPAQPGPRYPQVRHKQNAFEVKYRKAAAAKRIVVGTGGVEEARAALVAHLRKLRRVPTGSPEWGVIKVTAGPKVPVSELVKTLDAVRDKSATVGAKGGKGCRFRFHRKAADWRLVPDSRAACWFPYPYIF